MDLIGRITSCRITPYCVFRGAWGVALVISLLVTGCSGSSSTSPATTNVGGNQQPASDSSGSSGAVLAGITRLPSVDTQPNTVSPDFAEDTTGRQHVAYSDIQGRAFYGTCIEQCSELNNWFVLQLFESAIDDILGYTVPKIRIDDNNGVHIAFAVNFTGGSVFAQQEIYYAQCASVCSNINNWTASLVHSNSEGFLEAELQGIDWFDVTATGQPRIAFVDSAPGLFGDEFLYLLSCDAECSQSGNWRVQEVAPFDLASPKPAAIRVDSFGNPNIVANFEVVGASTSRLLHFACSNPCFSNNLTWQSAVELQVLVEDFLNPYAYAYDISENGQHWLAVHTQAGQRELTLHACANSCQTASWNSTNIISRVPFPSNIVSLSRPVTLSASDNQLRIGLIGKKRTVNVPSTVLEIACDADCLSGSWRYQELADTSTINFPDQGICLFIGTAANGPLRLTRSGAGFVLFPHWGCSSGPVEIIEPDGNRYIDYNADIRFFEIAAFAQ